MKNIETFKTKTKVKKNHKIHIDDVPFDDGQDVEIIISVSSQRGNCNKLKESLIGSVIKYDNPFEQVIISKE